MVKKYLCEVKTAKLYVKAISITVVQCYIEELCKEHGFSCRFVYRSVVITTPLSDWCFDYHESRKTLWHESTVKINFETGDYAKAHCQLKNRKMTIAETISYIAKHEEWAKDNRPSKSNSCD